MRYTAGMDPAFWRSRWQAGQIGFHEGRPNHLLERYLDRLPPGGRVLVPLCGKTEDLAFLAARGHDVVGVELVEDAVAAFFHEHGATPIRTLVDDLTCYQHRAITIFAGDVFAVTAAVLGAVDAIYDRAALIALPPPDRARYVAHVRTLAPRAPTLLVTLEYPQAAMPGPPFAVPEDEVRALFADAAIEPLADEPLVQPRLAAAGATGRQRCFWIARP
ncbi:MAG: thiopurine S-methyltransferase [Myxococcales bacterium]|nr:thiopurine S-methyltransferase [Myxococcales bacterium]